MRDIFSKSLKFLPDFSVDSTWISWESLGILLKIRHCFISYESTENPYEFCRDSLENPWRINADISPQYPCGFSFHWQPKILRGFPSTKDPPSPGIPYRIHVILPAGNRVIFFCSLVPHSTSRPDVLTIPFHLKKSPKISTKVSNYLAKPLSSGRKHPSF